MACSFCHDACCKYEVGVTIFELSTKAKVMQHVGELSMRVAAPVDEWFEDDIVMDSEVPGGQGQWARSDDDTDACVFLNPTGRGCQIHSFALEKSIDYHELKPFNCWLFPLTLVDHTLQMSGNPKLSTQTLPCLGAGESLYRGVREEVLHIFGETAVAEIDALEAEVLSSSISPY